MLVSLANDFEAMLEKDSVCYLEEKVFFQLIQYYEQQFLIEKALEVIDFACDQYPYRSEFHIVKARLLLYIAKYKEALEVLEFAETMAPMEADITNLKIRTLSNLGFITEATELLNQLKCIGLSHDAVEVFLSESYLYEVNKDYKRMFKVLSKALLLEPDHAECLERIWKCVEISRQYQKSIELHKHLVDLVPYNALAWYNLGHSFSSIGEYELAIQALEYAFIVDKDMEIAYIDCADLCMQIKDYQHALSIYEEANQYFGPDSEMLVYIAECQINLNNFLSAKASLYTALSMDPYNDEIYFNLGKCYTKEKNWPSAINAYKKAISIDNDREEYHGWLAETYIQIGKYELAQHHLTRAAEILPEESKFWFQNATILIKNNQLSEALALLDEAEDYAFDASLMYCRAAILLRLGHKRQALEILDEALMDNFDEHHALFELEPQLKFDKDILSIIHYYEGEK